MSDLTSERSVSLSHYPFVTKTVLRLFEEGSLSNVNEVIVEPEYGYISRLTYADGSHRVTYGYDVGLNVGTAGDLSKDKGYAKFILRAIGVNCPDGQEFLLPWWAEAIGTNKKNRGKTDHKTADQAANYIETELDYPVYIKPVGGSKGLGVFKITSAEDLDDVMQQYNEQRIKVALVETAVPYPDYRVVMLDGELISAYRRIPLHVIGDGQSTIRELVLQRQEMFELEGRDTRLTPEDPRINHHLKTNGMTLEDVLAANTEIALTDISNLSAGGTSEDVTEIISQRWIDLSAYVAQNFTLRLCGVDLATQDITSAEANYSVLEVNASPGLDHYASSGEAQRKKVDELYTKVLNAPPNS